MGARVPQCESLKLPYAPKCLLNGDHRCHPVHPSRHTGSDVEVYGPLDPLVT